MKTHATGPMSSLKMGPSSLCRRSIYLCSFGVEPAANRANVVPTRGRPLGDGTVAPAAAAADVPAVPWRCLAAVRNICAVVTTRVVRKHGRTSRSQRYFGRSVAPHTRTVALRSRRGGSVRSGPLRRAHPQMFRTSSGYDCFGAGHSHYFWTLMVFVFLVNDLENIFCLSVGVFWR